MDQALIGSSVVGAVNFASILFPSLTYQGKMLLAIVLAVVLQYVPFDLSPVLKGLEVALASSGVYKVAQVVSKS